METLPHLHPHPQKYNNYISTTKLKLEYFLRLWFSKIWKNIEKWYHFFKNLLLFNFFFLNLVFNPLVGPSIFISIFQTFDIIFSNVKRLKYSLSRITSALSVREGTPSREEGHLELLDLRIHSKRYSESYW